MFSGRFMTNYNKNAKKLWHTPDLLYTDAKSYETKSLKITYWFYVLHIIFVLEASCKSY